MEQATIHSSASLAVDISGLRFKNPVLTASGTFGYGVEFARFFDISRLGGFCTKGLSLHPMEGNAPGRIAETPAGMLNAIGLENVGIDRFVTEKLPQLEPYDTHVVANILGKTIDEFAQLARRLDPFPKVSCLELNISCPNIKEGGIHFGHDPEMAHRVVRAVKENTAKPVWVKLSPNVTDIRVMALACEQAGADALTLVNTFVGMSIDIYRRRPVLSNKTGGLSGPAIRPLAVRMVYQVAEAVRIPVIGIGGIMCGRDAVEFLMAGAIAVQVGTANFTDPHAALKVLQGIDDFCKDQGVRDIMEIVGAARQTRSSC
jgi:dihydroorotate dehydrogenase (NAD+) catalytic subunit